MDWMATTQERRADPRALWREVRSVIVLAINYGPSEDPREATQRGELGAVSVYARARDYHDVVKGKLKQLAGWWVARAGGDVKVFVDTAPVMEKPLAAAAGIGWQGKHTNLVSREFGSWLFLGSMFTNLELPFDVAEVDHCGTCRACLDACPTNALPAPYQIDARRCISYLTIEHKGPIAREFRAAIGNRIYGCDDCLAACPWNKFATQAQEAKLSAPDWRHPPLLELVALDDAAFRARFAGGPIKRIGHNRFMRNVVIALGNSGDRGAIDALKIALQSPAAMVRGAAVWALGQLCTREEGMILRHTHGACESDAETIQEWSDAFPGDAFPSDFCPSDVSPSDICPSDICPSGISPSETLRTRIS